MIANRWLILAILFLARFSLGFQFQTTGTLTPELMGAFAIDYSGIGLLVGLFMLPGIALSVPAGFAGYWWGDTRSVLTGLALMIAGGVICGAGDTIGVVMFGRLLSGAGAVCLFVMLSKVVMDHFDYRTLLFAMSIFVLGWPIGIAAGQATQTTIADIFSWREVFYVSSGLCFLSFVLVLFLTFWGRPQRATNVHSLDCGGAAWTQVNLSRSEFFWINVAGVIWMCLNGAYVVLVTFGPVYLMELDVGAVEAAVSISMISWAFIVGLPIGGYLAYRHNLPNSVMVVGLITSIVCGFLVPLSGSAQWLFVFSGLALAFATSAIASLPAVLLSKEHRAIGLGIYFSWHFVGATVLPVAAGMLRDASGTAAPVIQFASLLLAVCLIGLVAIWCLRDRWQDRHVERDDGAARPLEEGVH